MYYKNIYIRDFGIFKNQQLNNLSKNLVVIGGKNRAGKSTFLKLLRYLPYGLPQNSSIPPANKEYYIEAEMKSENENYQLYLKGFSDTKVIKNNNKEYSRSKLFNQLDFISYKQLFTISINELQKISKIKTKNNQKKQLYSILLGAGMSELLKLPELSTKYFNYAKNIGGKLGDPSVALFKSDYNNIKNAEEIRDKALLEITEYNQKKDELKENNSELKKKRKEIETAEERYFILDLLKNNYELIEKTANFKIKLNNIDSEVKEFNSENFEKSRIYQEKLAEENEKLLNEKKQLLEFLKQEKLTDFLEVIEKNAAQIDYFWHKEDLLIEKIKNYKKEERRLNDSFSNLSIELKEMSSLWKKPLKELENIKIDLIKENELKNLLIKFENLDLEINNLENKLDELKEKIENEKIKLKSLKFQNPKYVLKITYIVLAFSLSILGISFIFDLSQLKYFALITALAAYLYHNSNYKTSKANEEKESEIKSSIKIIENKIKNIQNKLENKNYELNIIENKLSEISKNLGLKNKGNFRYLESYFREIKNKKKQYLNLKNEKKQLQIKNEKINNELEELIFIREEISPFVKLNFNIRTDNDLINNYQILFEDLKKLKKIKDQSFNYLRKEESYYLLAEEAKAFLGDFEAQKNLMKRLESYYFKAKKAEDYKELKEELTYKKSQLKNTLNSSNRIKEILQKNKKEANKSYYQLFLDIYNKFSSVNMIKKEMNSLEKKILEQKTKKKNLEENITTLKNELKRLSSSTKIEKAQEKINNAQNNLEKKAHRYAVNKSVYLIIKKLHSKILEQAEKKLLAPASDILAKISSDYYKDIKTADNIEESDFKVIDYKGEEISSVNHLSQGSLEQLFLSIRLSRIKEIKPALPVIIDDSLVNFDRDHLYQTVKIISELAKTHQIFLLSCHPHLISYVDKLNDKKQYWKIEDGNFELTSKEKLISHLNYR